jgi:hypothetical protein
LGLNGIFQSPFEAASDFAGRRRRRIVNVLGCVNGIASNTYRIFLGLSNGSTEIWIGGAAFRHDDSPLRVGALAGKVPAGHSFPFIQGAPEIRTRLSLGAQPLARLRVAYRWRTTTTAFL